MDATTVIGPPGTGKTTYISRQIERAADRFGNDSVAAVSLTKTAASRLVSKMREEHVDADLEHVGTLHSLCFRYLDRPKLVYPKLSEFAEEYGLDLRANRSIDDLGDTPGETADDKLMQEIDVCRHRMWKEQLWPSYLLSLYRKYEAWKRAHGLLDFTDLIEQALEQCPEGLGRGAFFGDEAQDWSRMELELVKSWSEHCDHAVICGDADQSLYSWRGASVRAFLTWCDRKIVLSQSYRVPVAVHEYSQRWVRQIKTRTDAEYRPKIDQETLEYVPGSVRTSRWSMRDADKIVEEIKGDLERGRKVMVLTTCGYMLSPMLGVLRSCGLPFHNPFRETNGAWNPCHVAKKRTSPAGRILSFLTSVGVSPESGRNGSKRCWNWEELQRWTEPLQTRFLIRGARKKLQEMKRSTDVVSFEDLQNLLSVEALYEGLRGNLEWYKLAIQKDRLGPMEFPLHVAGRSGAGALANDPKIVVGTIHSVKGGEADVVYLFPDLSPQAVMSLDRSEDNRDAMYRVFYVGITRARDEVVLCSPSGSDMHVEWLGV